MVKSITSEDRLVEELFSDSKRKYKCPFIRRDSEGAYCGRGLVSGEEIVGARRSVCDVISLQMWCLSGSYRKCIFYKGESF